MDFFRSVFSDDPEPKLLPGPANSRDATNNSSPSSPHSTPDDDDDDDSNRRPNPSAWSFGGLVEILASKSESVMQTYGREFGELKSGLEKETAVIRGVASRAVENLPVSFDTGASVAQESLESVGQAIDDLGSSVWRGTAEIISHCRQTLSDDHSGGHIDNNNNNNRHQFRNHFRNQGSGSGRYRRFDALVRAMQCDVSTYTQEPDLSNFDRWKLGFDLDQKGGEIDSLFQENRVMERIYMKLVPGTVDRESFWCRYFYRFHRLRQAEDARACLVKKAVSGGEEEILSWDVDDDDYDGSANDDCEGNKATTKLKGIPAMGGEVEENSVEKLQGSDDEKDVWETNGDDKSVVKAGERLFVVEGKVDVVESSKDSDFSVVSSQASLPAQDDLGWDEIEDGVSSDEGKVTSGGNTNRSDSGKQLGAAEDDEDLSWGIEDDEEPTC